MNLFLVLLAKEVKGHLKTYRAVVVAGVFFFFGLATPLMLKFLPKIMELSGEDLGGIQLPQFTPAQVLESYFGSFGQIGLLTAVLLAMGAVANEMGGAAAMVLSKPVGRGRFILAKLLSLAAIVAPSLAIGAAGAYLYTSILFGELHGLGFTAANLLLLAYIVVVLAVTVFFSCCFRSSLAAGACGLAAAIGLTAAASLPAIGSYAPGALLRWAESAATGAGLSAWGALAFSSAAVAAATVGGWLLLKRRDL